MSGELAASLLGAGIGVLSGVVGPRVVRGLPEPELAVPPPEGEEETQSRLEIRPVYEKVLYADLGARPRLAVGLAVAAGLLGALLGYRLGWSGDLLVALALLPAGTWLGYVDMRTTFLPTVLIYPTLLLCALASLGVAVGSGSYDDLQRAAIGCLAYGGIFYALWWSMPGFGFGDVRLAFLLGLVLGHLGWEALATGFVLALFLGGFGGALLALLKVIDARRNPYGPWMLLGALLGATYGAQIADALGY